MKTNYRYLFFGITFIILVFLLYSVRQYDRKLKIVFLDVGQGDAIFISSPYGKQVLIDGGKYEFLESKVSRYMPWYDRSIDLMVATHPDLDHVGGLVGIARRYHVGLFLHSGLLAGASAYQELARIITRKNVPSESAFVGQTIKIDPLTQIQILFPETGIDSFDANEYSIVARLSYQNTSVLLTGDANIFTEQELVDFLGEGIKSDILKLGHHGSHTSSSEHFLSSVQPSYAIVSASCDNTYGHPDEGVVKRIHSLGIKLLSTCEHKDIVFESNGKEWKLK